ncbi:hypothetical protein C8Q77DRAFT_1096364 [Trametes polyzona]|nr:hypothetical protein C8Q77DRAFT_1096364 [Trametes polyzona]
MHGDAGGLRPARGVKPKPPPLATYTSAGMTCMEAASLIFLPPTVLPPLDPARPLVIRPVSRGTWSTTRSVLATQTGENLGHCAWPQIRSPP